MSRRAETVVLLGMGSLILALVALNVMAAQGRFETGDDEPPAVAPATTEEEPAPTEAEAETEPAETATIATEAAEATTTAARAPAPPRLVLTAARGECYLAVRRASATGELLYEAILPQGGTVDFTGARLWLRIGASTSLDATLDGEPLTLPAGTVDVVVTRAGVQSA